MTKLLAFSVLIALVAGSCEAYKCIEGNNNVVRFDRTTDPFDQVYIEGDYDVFITQDSTLDNSSGFNIVIEGDDNLVPYITTTVSERVLTISNANNRCFRSDAPEKIFVTLKNLTRVELKGSGMVDAGPLTVDFVSFVLSGSGTIFSDEIVAGGVYAEMLGSGTIDLVVASADWAEAELAGSGNILLSGYANTGQFALPGSGEIRADLLDVDDCFVDISGSGNAYVYPYYHLSAKISGSGSVYYRRRPVYDIFSDITGTGGVYPMPKR